MTLALTGQPHGLSRLFTHIDRVKRSKPQTGRQFWKLREVRPAMIRGEVSHEDFPPPACITPIRADSWVDLSTRPRNIKGHLLPPASWVATNNGLPWGANRPVGGRRITSLGFVHLMAASVPPAPAKPCYVKMDQKSKNTTKYPTDGW